ncbi:MAG: alpha/beta hydrolase [Acidimicrobiales bacterium]
MSPSETIMLTHVKARLALHHLADGVGRPLLLLHGLGEASPTSVPSSAAAWPGPVWALDFTGHGASTVPLGGGYTSEMLMADVDIAIAHLGNVTILGRGLGGYVALLIAGARSKEVRGSIITDGPGLFGGPNSGPSSAHILTVAHPPTEHERPSPDPFALIELSTDVRPPDYAANFARMAAHMSDLDRPLTVAARGRSPWIDAVVQEVGVDTDSVEAALANYARVT